MLRMLVLSSLFMLSAMHAQEPATSYANPIKCLTNPQVLALKSIVQQLDIMVKSEWSTSTSYALYNDLMGLITPNLDEKKIHAHLVKALNYISEANSAYGSNKDWQTPATEAIKSINKARSNSASMYIKSECYIQ